MNHTPLLSLSDSALLAADRLDAEARAAAAAFVAAGTAANTVRSYRSALAYWAGWLQLRYRRHLEDGALPEVVAVQFIVDHLARPQDGDWVQLLPPALDTALVASGVKAKGGPLSYNTVRHRLAVLAKWHGLKNWPSPTESAAVKTLLREARKAQSRQGVSVRKKTAAVREPLEAMLATCTDGVRGLRDRALLLLAWSGGGRRRSEVVALQVGDVRPLDAGTWLYALGATKTETEGERRELPLRGPAAQALTEWLAAAPASTGPLFRRVYKGGRISHEGLSGDQVARIVKRRAELAELQGDWAAHSLRSGFISEAGRQGVPLGEVMAMTEHRSIPTVMGYFQAGTLLNSSAAHLLSPTRPKLHYDDSPYEARKRMPRDQVESPLKPP
ncbi:TPA: site-specific integrase [Pseudomonas aeruginosa]|nr:site-specific integrase [Pseudomonas aeruginosa]